MKGDECHWGFAGESPSSSSASDVDNFNNHSLGPSEKSTMAQMLGRAATASPHTMAGPAAAAMAAPSSHTIVPPRLHSSFTQFLKDVCSLSVPFPFLLGTLASPADSSWCPLSLDYQMQCRGTFTEIHCGVG